MTKNAGQPKNESEVGPIFEDQRNASDDSAEGEKKTIEPEVVKPGIEGNTVEIDHKYSIKRQKLVNDHDNLIKHLARNRTRQELADIYTMDLKYIERYFNENAITRVTATEEILEKLETIEAVTKTKIAEAKAEGKKRGIIGALSTGLLGLITGGIIMGVGRNEEIVEQPIFPAGIHESDEYKALLAENKKGATAIANLKNKNDLMRASNTKTQKELDLANKAFDAQTAADKKEDAQYETTIATQKDAIATRKEEIDNLRSQLKIANGTDAKEDALYESQIKDLKAQLGKGNISRDQYDSQLKDITAKLKSEKVANAQYKTVIQDFKLKLTDYKAKLTEIEQTLEKTTQKYKGFSEKYEDFNKFVTDAPSNPQGTALANDLEALISDYESEIKVLTQASERVLGNTKRNVSRSLEEYTLGTKKLAAARKELQKFVEGYKKIFNQFEKAEKDIRDYMDNMPNFTGKLDLDSLSPSKSKINNNETAYDEDSGEFTPVIIK